jgi:hypothetical protein
MSRYFRGCCPLVLDYRTDPPTTDCPVRSNFSDTPAIIAPCHENTGFLLLLGSWVVLELAIVDVSSLAEVDSVMMVCA